MRRQIVLLIAIVLALAACASGPKFVDDTDPWLVDRASVLRGGNVIGLADLILPDGLQDPQAIRDNYSRLIEIKLQEKGYTVVRAKENQALWDRSIASLGGNSDSLAHDPKLIARVMTQTLAKRNVTLDGVLIPAVTIVEAQFKSGRAAWDGATQSIKTGSAVKNFWAGSPEGTLGALSLDVTLVGPDGTLYYQNAGGIEVLSKIEGKEFVLVPRQELFNDQGRNKEAVDLALDPLFE